LEAGWRNTYQPLAQEWRDWTRANPVLLRVSEKRVYTTIQDIPAYLEVATIDAAAEVVGGDWSGLLNRARDRLRTVREVFPGAIDMVGVLRAVVRYTDADFELLIAVARWFNSNTAAGYTPRQVPIPGVHAKWLNTHQPEILALCGLGSLGLLPKHPARIHFTYLDPAYRATGKRVHDSATVGDGYSLPYVPSVVVISENKDTAIHFPPIPGGIAVEGGGSGGKTAAAFSWITDASQLYYWGDIDAHGYEILNGWRADGVPVTSVLMDMATYSDYELYGADTDKHGSPLTPSNPRDLADLTAEERAVYDRLVSQNHRGHRRIEQERIPLQVAVAAISVNLSQ
jgi:hypothetical protein